MKLFQPQLQLARETYMDEPDAFFLHVVTFCSNTSFRADGHSVNDSLLNEGKLEVEVKIYQDPDLPDMNYLTPIVHTIKLGHIAFPEDEGVIDVRVIGDVQVAPSTVTRSGTKPGTKTKTGGKGTVSTTSADDKSRPIDDDHLS